MDVFYLAIAYLSTLRNWVSNDAFRVSRFLYFYRLVGVVAFELTQTRALLLVFPNTFEYFFIAYEGGPVPLEHPAPAPHRLAGRRGRDLGVRQAAAGVLDPRRPARRHRHPGGLRLGVAAADRAAARAGRRPLVRGPAPDARRPTGTCAWPRTPCPRRWTRPPSGPPGTSSTGGCWSTTTFEKVMLVGLLSVIFSQTLPGTSASNIELFVGTAAFVVVNAALVLVAARRSVELESVLLSFARAAGDQRGTRARGVGAARPGRPRRQRRALLRDAAEPAHDPARPVAARARRPASVGPHPVLTSRGTGLGRSGP